MIDGPNQQGVSRRTTLVAAAGAVTRLSVRGASDRFSGVGVRPANGYGEGGYGHGGYGGGRRQPASTPDDVTGNGRVATDPDDDGLYEDVAGDGTFDIVDIAALLEALDGISAEDAPFFDFNADDGLSVLDVAALLREL